MAKFRNDQKKPNVGTIVIFVIALVVMMPELFAVLATLAVFAAVLGGPFLIAYRAKKKGSASDKRRMPPAQRQSFPVDDCPKPICFHKDKGEHHVKRGKEIDPWDRPDIDISKYQRRQ